MFLALELDFDGKEINNLLEGDLLNPGQLQDIANRMILMIEQRTQQGVDAFGAPFKPYSVAYADKRRKAGRSENVDMSFTNQMLGSLIGSADNGSALISFADSSLAQIADYHTSAQSRSKIPLRDFLNLAEDGSEAEILANMAADFIAGNIFGEQVRAANVF